MYNGVDIDVDQSSSPARGEVSRRDGGEGVAQEEIPLSQQADSSPQTGEQLYSYNQGSSLHYPLSIIHSPLILLFVFVVEVVPILLLFIHKDGGRRDVLILPLVLHLLLQVGDFLRAMYQRLIGHRNLLLQFAPE